ncbi:enoyl-CoA hydratase-related protein [Stackebrandtia soli]|uniref:enoyl-CoA hydratase-related protein n=1 Tax=Stackebrandtia soli TaxID=1892856 RepID=UPI0039E7F372
MTNGNTDELVTYVVERGIATLTLNSHHNRNALSAALMRRLLELLGAAVADDAVRVVVLSHEGTVFCSGADLKETAAARRAGEVPAALLTEVLAALWECPKPTIAAVKGSARAGGLGLIAACDIAVCSGEASFAFTEVRLGVIPAVISAPVLRRLSSRDATELYLTGRVFTGDHARQIGLVTHATSWSDVDQTVADYAADIVRGAPKALAGTKTLLRRGEEDLRGELAALATTSAGFFLSDEGREGVAAFAEKRDPSWIPDA